MQKKIDDMNRNIKRANASVYTILTMVSIVVCCVTSASAKTVAYRLPNLEAYNSLTEKARKSEFSSRPICFYDEAKNANDSDECSDSRVASPVILSEWIKKLNYSAEEKAFMTVEVSLNVKQLLDVVDKDQSLILRIGATKKWNDCRMQWKSSTVELLDIKPSEYKKMDIFMPYLETPEVVGSLFPEGEEIRVTVNCKGEITLYYDIEAEVSCEMDFRMYPFDVHYCTLTFRSFYKKYMLRLETKLSTDLHYTPNDVWSMTTLRPICNHKCHNNLTVCSCHDHEYRMFLRRQPYYQIVNLLVPAAFIAFISSSVFLVPPNSSDKMGLSLAILLSLYMFCQMMYDKMPETGSTLPLLSQYFLVCIGVVTASCVFSAVSSAIFAALPPLPACLKSMVVLLGPYLMPDMLESKKRHSFSNIASNGHDEETAPHSSVEAQLQSVDDKRSEVFTGFCLHAPEKLTWAAVGALLDRVLFILHTLSNILVLLLFVFQGYYSWYGYAAVRDLMDDEDIKDLCVQLKNQKAKYDDLPC